MSAATRIDQTRGLITPQIDMLLQRVTGARLPFLVLAVCDDQVKYISNIRDRADAIAALKAALANLEAQPPRSPIVLDGMP